VRHPLVVFPIWQAGGPTQAPPLGGMMHSQQMVSPLLLFLFGQGDAIMYAYATFS
jgi:hypothetical protein